ncbi:hypothetical protein DAEQUDRAFT_722708 [Daedalea quercina L-15889]|uniref:Uncharacterized protein n=1 Tax=Daedalea quercina L-15889 TaxID=1314783 RepID=A0A165SVI0_9APHY|nr:hypothetical protein DAEQUDRAFT_722708 [Daedalea quercina L-15889]
MFSIPIAPKRKYQDADFSDDDEEPTLGRQVLPVANLPADFNGVPEDGLQYLFTVRRDARSLPQITRVANPYEVKEEQRESVIGEMNAEHPLLPSEEWREVFLKRFKNFRKNSMQPTLRVDVPSASRKLIPDKKERDLWWAFLTGQPASVWDPPKKPKPPKSNKTWRGRSQGSSMDTLVYSDSAEPSQELSYSLEDGRIFSTSSSEMWRVTTDGVELTSSLNAATSLPTPSGTPAPPDRIEELSSSNTAPSGPASGSLLEDIRPPEPTPTFMKQIDHRYALHLLMYFTHWINLHLERGSTPSPHAIADLHLRWIFVLLSRVEDYVSADETSLLRSLARACMSLIEEGRTRGLLDTAGITAEPPPIDEPACWMVITAVVSIWGQRDLWMDAEAMLRRLPT